MDCRERELEGTRRPAPGEAAVRPGPGEAAVAAMAGTSSEARFKIEWRGLIEVRRVFRTTGW